MSDRNRPRLRGSSPWDMIQDLTEIPGSNGELIIVSTPGHGGMWVGPSLRPRFRKMFPEFQGYAGFPWLEEDCDICLGVIAFPEFFGEAKVQRAIATVRAMRDYFVEANEYLDRQDAAAMLT